MQSAYTHGASLSRIHGTRTSTARLSTPVRLTAVTTARDVAASPSRCERSHPGSTSFDHLPLAYERTVQSQTRSPCAGVRRITRSPVAVSRAIRALGAPGAFAPSHGDAGTSAG